MEFGLNSTYVDSTLDDLIESPKPFINFAKQNYIDYLRYPGGLESRTFFWDKPLLIPQARRLYAATLKTKYSDKESKAEHNERLANNQIVKDSSYRDFLRFCKRSSIKPVIVLGIWFYHDDKNVYAMQSETGGLNNPNWSVIEKNIKEQAAYSHKTYSDVIHWEIGNEDQHIFSAKDYAEIAYHYASAIKSLYPSDKILVNFTLNPESKKVEDNWNEDMFNYLSSKNAVSLIDYIAPHYYKAFKDEESNDNLSSSSGDLQKRFTKVNIYNTVTGFDNFFQKYPNVHMFITEFGLFKKSSNPNYNSQLEGLLMLYYLMQFNATPRLDAIIRHGFTQTSSAFYFNDKTFKKLNYSFDPADDPSDNIFKYIPPIAKSTKLFFDNNPVKANKAVTTSNYGYTITSYAGTTIINILNFTANPVNISTGDLEVNLTGKKASFKSYQFNDLHSKQWNYEKTTVKISSAIQVAPFSYSVITFSN